MNPSRENINPRRLRRSGAATLIVAMLPLQILAAEVSGCAAPQRTLFSCSTGKKIISVCGSIDLTATAGHLQYRVTRAGALELSYPLAGVDWRTGNIVQGGTLMFSGGGGAFMSFTNVPFRYIVYSASGRGWGSKAGVVVEKNGTRIASLKCKGKVISELGPELFAQASIADAAASFELP